MVCPGEVLNVRAPPNKDFAFVEFQTHAQAQAAIDSKGTAPAPLHRQRGWLTVLSDVRDASGFL